MSHTPASPKRIQRKRYCGPCDKWVPAAQTTCKACGADTDKAEQGLRCGICGYPSGNTDTCVACMTKIIRSSGYEY